jgi:sugar lactone lactonase YvrE
MQAVLSIATRNLVGESPVWDAARQRFLWLDQFGGTIHEARRGSAGDWHESRSWQLSRPLGGLVPRQQGGLMLGSGTEILSFEEESGATRLFTSLDADPAEVMLNEIKCDRLGRLWAGTRGTDVRSHGLGALYRVDPDRTVTRVLTDVSVSNGMDWSPDGETFYYIDSPTFTVAAFEYDPTAGTLKNRRTLLTFARGASAPDGMTVDREGCLWVAIPGTGQVRRYSPYGKELTQVLVSAPVVSSCAFGGADERDLWITSAAIRLPDEVLEIIGVTAEQAQAWATAPGAGGAFVCTPGPRGYPATPFAG